MLVSPRPTRIEAICRAAKAISTLAGSAAGAQLLSILALPIIGRLYGPNAFGEYSIALVTITLVSSLSSLQLHQAVIIPTDDAEANRLVQCVSTTALGGALAVLFTASLVTILRGQAGPLILVGLLAFLVWVMPVGLALQAWLVRKSQIRAIAFVSIARVVVTVASQLGLTLITTGAWGLLAGLLVGELTAMLLILFYSRNGLPYGTKLFSWQPTSIKNYRDFAIYGTAQELMNTASQGIPTIVFGALFGPHVAGAYAMAVKVTVGPANLIANAVRSTVAPVFARSHDDLSRQVITWSGALLALVSLPALVAYLYGGGALTRFFGAGWSVAAGYVGWLGLWAAMLVVNAPATMALRVARKQRQATVYNIVVLVVRTLAIVLGALTLGDQLTVAGFALLGVLLNFGLIVYAVRLVARGGDRV